MRVRLVVEGGHLAITRAAVQLDRLLQGTVGFQAHLTRSGPPRMPLKLQKHPPPKPETARPRIHPHSLQLGRGAGVKLERAAADSPTMQSRDEERSPGRHQLLRVSRDAAGRIETCLEAGLEFGEILVDAPPRVAGRRIFDRQRDLRCPKEPFDLGHRGHQLRALMLGEGLEATPGDHICAPVEHRAFRAPRPGEPREANAPVVRARVDLDQSLSLQRSQDTARIARVQAKSSSQLSNLPALPPELPQGARHTHTATAPYEYNREGPQQPR